MDVLIPLRPILMSEYSVLELIFLDEMTNSFWLPNLISEKSLGFKKMGAHFFLRIRSSRVPPFGHGK